MNLNLPTGNVYTVEPESEGAAVYGVQKALNKSGLFDKPIPCDGVYGPKTTTKVSKAQGILFGSNAQDGRFGPKTSKALSHLLQKKAVGERSLPDKITYSLVSLESGDLIAANNWSVAGGVDLSYVQRRVFGPPYEDADVQRAFDGLYQFQLLVTQLRERHDHFWTSVNEVDTHEMAWRLGVLNHWYPSAAYTIARDGIAGLSAYWTNAQGWMVAMGRKFDDGAPVVTPLEGCQHYALGAPEHNHEGVAVRGVSGWNTP